MTRQQAGKLGGQRTKELNHFNGGRPRAKTLEDIRREHPNKFYEREGTTEYLRLICHANIAELKTLLKPMNIHREVRTAN